MIAGQHSSKDRAESGFTLLEVLIGLLISSLILAGLSLAMGTVNRGYEQLGTVIDRQGELATGLSVFEDDVSRIARLPEDPAQPLQFVFSGTPREMIYVLGERPGSNEAGLYWVRLAIRNGQGGSELVRQRAAFRRPPAAADNIPWADDVVLVSGPFAISLSYRSTRAGLRDWAGNWEARNMLPNQVRLDIKDEATGRARIPPFTATLKIAAEASCADANAAGCTIKSDGALVSAEGQKQEGQKQEGQKQ